MSTNSVFAYWKAILSALGSAVMVAISALPPDVLNGTGRAYAMTAAGALTTAAVFMKRNGTEIVTGVDQVVATVRDLVAGHLADASAQIQGLIQTVQEIIAKQNLRQPPYQIVNATPVDPYPPTPAPAPPVDSPPDPTIFTGADGSLTAD